MKIKSMLVTTTLALGLSVQAFADTTSTLNTEASRMNTLAASHGETNVTGKISGTFNSFLGADSTAVVTGLRNGTPITLTTTTPAATPGAAPTVTTNVITPPTGKMGHGNVFTSLALAKQQLGQMGISQPTPQQLQAALTGGEITTATGTTTTTGILTMRSQGMGWGQIAQQQGTKLGPVISGLKNANQQMTTTNASSTGSQSTSSSSAIVSGSGKSHGNSGKNVSGQNTSGEGIVSGSNRSTGHGNAYGKGIVSGSGQSARGNSSITTAGGHGNSGQAKGQGK
ncbi:MAG TPA: hypothetical protein VI585_10760 [Candidatus Binatia bacterium]